VLGIAPYDLSIWISNNLLNIRLPVPGPNSTLNIQTDILPLMATISNNMSLATELYNVCVGAKAPWTIKKKLAGAEDKTLAENNITTLGAHVDILYRTIQTLDAQRETASRLMTGTNQTTRLGM
jgi:hypothetical protein